MTPHKFNPAAAIAWIERQAAADVAPPVVVEVEERRRWHVVQIRPGAGSDVAKEIATNGMLCYLPTELHRVRVRLNTGRRYRDVRRPMFPGYVFSRFDPHGPLWPLILEIDGVVRVLCHESVPVPVPDHIVALVRQIETDLGKQGSVRKRTHGLRIGTAVRLTEPPQFEGLFGEVGGLDVDGKGRCRVDIGSLRVHVEPETLEVIAAGDLRRRRR